MFSSKNSLFIEGLKYISPEKRSSYYSLLIPTEMSAIGTEFLANTAQLERTPPSGKQNNLALDLKVTQFVFEHGNEHKQAFAESAKSAMTTHMAGLSQLSLQLEKQDKEQIQLCLKQGSLLISNLNDGLPHPIQSSLSSLEQNCKTLDPSLFERCQKKLFSVLNETFAQGFKNQNKIDQLKIQIKEANSNEMRDMLSAELFQVEASERNRVHEITKITGTISHGFSIIAALANFSDNPQIKATANKISTIANATCSIFNNIACFSTIAAVSGPLAPFVGIFGGISTLFQLFQTGPSELEIVSEQLVFISKQIAASHNEIKKYLGMLSEQLSTGFNYLAEYMKHLDTRFDRLDTRFDRIESHIKELANFISEIDKYALKRFLQLHENDRLLLNESLQIKRGIEEILTSQDAHFFALYTQKLRDIYIQGCAFHTRIPFDKEKRSPGDVVKFYFKIKDWVETHSHNPTLTAENAPLNCLFRSQATANPWEYQIGALVQYFYQTQGHPSFPRLANPLIYLSSIRAFRDFLFCNPEAYDRESPILRREDLMAMASRGQDIENTLTAIRTSRPFFAHLFQQYRESVQAVLETIRIINQDGLSDSVSNLMEQMSAATIARTLEEAGSQHKQHGKILDERLRHFQTWSQYTLDIGHKTWALADCAGVNPESLEHWRTLPNPSVIQDVLGRFIYTFHLLGRAQENTNDKPSVNPYLLFNDVIGRHAYLIQALGRAWDNTNNYAGINQLLAIWNEIAQTIQKLRSNALASENNSRMIVEDLAKTQSSLYQESQSLFDATLNQSRTARREKDGKIAIQGIRECLEKLRCLKSHYECTQQRLQMYIHDEAGPLSRLSTHLMHDQCKIGSGGNERVAEKIRPQVLSTRGSLGKLALRDENGVFVCIHERRPRSRSYFRIPLDSELFEVDNVAALNDLIAKWNELLNRVEETDGLTTSLVRFSELVLKSANTLLQDISPLIARLEALLPKVERHNHLKESEATLRARGFNAQDSFEAYLAFYLRDHERDELNKKIHAAMYHRADFRARLDKMEETKALLQAYIGAAFDPECQANPELKMFAHRLPDRKNLETLLNQYSGQHPSQFIYFILKNGLLGEILPELERKVFSLVDKAVHYQTIASRANLPQTSGCLHSNEALGILNELSKLYFPREAPLYQQDCLDQGLQVAAKHGNDAVIQALLERGANPVTQVSLTADMMPDEREIDRSEGRSPLSWLVLASQRPELISFFLRVSNMDPALQNQFQWTPVHQAAYMGAWAKGAGKIMKALLTHPRSRLTLFQRTNDNRTPIEIAQCALNDSKDKPKEQKRCKKIVALLEQATEEADRTRHARAQ